MDLTSSNLETKKLLGKLFIPPFGIGNDLRHTGHDSRSPGCLSFPHPRMHLRQNVWIHGSTFGSVNTSVQMGHSVISFNFIFITEASAILLICQLTLKIVFVIVNSFEKHKTLPVSLSVFRITNGFITFGISSMGVSSIAARPLWSNANHYRLLNYIAITSAAKSANSTIMHTTHDYNIDCHSWISLLKQTVGILCCLP